MKTLTGEIYLTNQQWAGIPDTYFEVRGSGLTGAVHYTVDFGYETGPEGWAEIRLDYKDGLMPMRIVVGPDDRKAGLVLGEVFQVYTGIMTVRFGYHTPPAPPKPKVEKFKASAWSSSYTAPYALPAAPASKYDEDWGEDPDLDDEQLDKLYDEWENRHERDNDSDIQQRINDMLGIDDARDDDPADVKPQGRHAKSDDRPIWLQVLEEEGYDVSDLEHFGEVMAEGAGFPKES